MEKIIKLEWSEEAIDDLQNIHDFIANFSKVRAEKIVDRIFERVSILEYGFVRIGQIEELLDSSPYEYRYLIEDYYKIIYRIIHEKVEVMKIFDVRQNPIKMRF